MKAARRFRGGYDRGERGERGSRWESGWKGTSVRVCVCVCVRHGGKKKEEKETFERREREEEREKKKHVFLLFSLSLSPRSPLLFRTVVVLHEIDVSVAERAAQSSIAAHAHRSHLRERRESRKGERRT